MTFSANEMVQFAKREIAARLELYAALGRIRDPSEGEST